ncbi:hypothetical protein BU200_06585 [Streptococcus acidominimus]|uniref:BIG2 domain-containing protein n=1 Tax=Streptococcus acidominimus TaxID=1326 RepID=A0A1Q8ECN5_STRAI|nr:hypothetical protein BU200_06585 [Streptococcus acidominimus]
MAVKDQNVTNLTATVSDFTGEAGTIASSNVTATFIKSTDAFTGMPGYGDPTRPIPQGNRAEANDILYTTKPVNVAAAHLQNLWLTVHVPKDAVAGTYRGRVSLTADQFAEALHFDYTLTVQDASLPDAVDFKNGFDIELWQNPNRVAEYYNVEPFSDEHLALMRPHIEKYKSIGGHTVTTTVVDEAWAGQTYGEGEIKFPSMVKWSKKANGKFAFDYTIFDKWVEFNKSLGIGDKIVAYSIAPWPQSIRYFDEASQSYKVQQAKNGTKEHTEVWREFLQDFMLHTESRGWKQDVYIGIDERGFHVNAFNLIDSVMGIDAKPFKTAGAMDHFIQNKDLAMRLTDWTVGSIAVKAHPREFEELRAAREKLGLRTTIYTCTGHIPGNFALSDPGESYWTMLYGASVKADGYLRWAYDSWVENPLVDTTHNAFEAGDPFLVYPGDKGADGPRSSLRLEKMAEGVRDVNKLLWIKKEVPSFSARVDDLLSTVKATYPNNKIYLTEAGKVQMANDMAILKEKINALTEEALAYKKTAVATVESVRIRAEDPLSLLAGSQQTLTAAIEPENLLNNLITWSSINEAVATVDQFGKVTAKRAGRTKIVARSQADPSKTSELVVEVKPRVLSTEDLVNHYIFSDENPGRDSVTGKDAHITSQDLVALENDFKVLRVSPDKAIVLSDKNSSLNHDWTVAFYVYRQTEANNIRESVLTSADGERSLDLAISPRNAWMGVHVANRDGQWLTFKNKPSKNRWHHVAYANTAANGLSVYVDGELVETINWTKNKDFFAPIEKIGGNGFSGLLTDLRVYRRGLNAEEVQTLLTNTDEVGLVVSKTNMEAIVGDKVAIDAYYVPSGDEATVLTFTSSDPAIATVDEFGVMTPLAKGTVTITINHPASNSNKTVTVEVSKKLNHHFAITEYRLPEANLSDIEKKPGTDRQYLGQPDMIMLDDNMTLITAYPVGHGAGPIVMQISRDGGKTWTEKTDIPKDWAHSYETPTLYKLNMTDGRTKLMMITGRPEWHQNTTGGWQTSISTDNGETWSDYTNHHPMLGDQKNFSVVAMASLVQLHNEAGQPIDKWLGVYHNNKYENFKTYLTFDENGNQVWSEPEHYLASYRDVESLYQICEVGIFRSPNGKRLVALGRSQSHNHHSVMFYSDDEGKTWSKPEQMQGGLQGERHKIVYDPISGRLIVTFREIILDYNRNGKIENNDWMAGDWVAWVGTYDDLMAQNEGEYRIRIAEDWSNNTKSGDTGYAGIVVQPDGTILTNSYGHWDKDFSYSWKKGITTDLSYIKLAIFKLGQVDQALGRVDKRVVEPLLAKLVNVDPSLYTAESVKALKNKVAVLVRLVEATDSQQIEIDRALVELEAALVALEAAVSTDTDKTEVDLRPLDPAAEKPKVPQTPQVTPMVHKVEARNKEKGSVLALKVTERLQAIQMIHEVEAANKESVSTLASRVSDSSRPEHRLPKTAGAVSLGMVGAWLIYSFIGLCLGRKRS